MVVRLERTHASYIGEILKYIATLYDLAEEDEDNVQYQAGLAAAVFLQKQVDEAHKIVSGFSVCVRVNAARALGYLASRGPPEVLRVGGACFAVASARLPQVTDALLACVSSPAVKVRWNVCCALGGTLQRHRQQEDLSATAWAPAAVRALLTLLRESSNFKVTAGSCLSSTRL